MSNMSKEAIEREIRRLQNELYVIENMNEEIYTNQRKIIGDRVKDQEYFYIDSFFECSCSNDMFDYSSSMRYENFNYFDDEQETFMYSKHFKLTAKLIRLRDKLNGDWIPDWESFEEMKYFIELYEDKIDKECHSVYRTSNLYFKTIEKREEFLKLIPTEEIIEYLSF